jgi:hypothetical protein
MNKGLVLVCFIKLIFRSNEFFYLILYKSTEFPYDNDVREKKFLGLIENRVNYTKMKDRKIVSNRVDPALPNNSIQTNKYNWANFFPKNILEQFSKRANLYFLVSFYLLTRFCKKKNVFFINTPPFKKKIKPTTRYIPSISLSKKKNSSSVLCRLSRISQFLKEFPLSSFLWL